MNDKQRLMRLEREAASSRRCLLVLALVMLIMLCGCAPPSDKWVSTAMMGVNSWEVEYTNIRVETKNKY